MPRNKEIKSVLIIGSGPIIIGQACEFDYSGSQASRSLREEGIEVSLINSNPATIMTDNVVADYVYLKPLEVKSIINILEERDIDAVLPTMGGQTALNLCIEADEKGIWEKYGVDIIGVDIEAIHITEDREQFRKLMKEDRYPCCSCSYCYFLFRRERNCSGIRISTSDQAIIYTWRNRSFICSYKKGI